VLALASDSPELKLEHGVDALGVPGVKFLDDGLVIFDTLVFEMEIGCRAMR
jgi:hypothetical protein